MKNYKRKNETGEIFRNCYKDPKIYTPDDIDTVISEYLKYERSVIGKKRVAYINCPCSFDIETSNLILNGEKTAFMYIWQLCLNGAVILGRHWEEFDKVMARISEALKLSQKRMLVIYVHNLAFECQFIRNRFNWDEVFATEERKPLAMRSSNGFEFRCSYRLSGYGLEKTCENLLKYKVKKMVNDLDYTLIRNSATKLSQKEIGYCVNDVVGVCAFILEEMERNGSITKIPMTATGYARNLCRDYCFGHGNKRKKEAYLRFMHEEMTLGEEEYDLIKEAYQGGFTHANARHAGDIQYDVSSYDFTSSYPAVLVAFGYPMSKAEKYTPKSLQDFQDTLKKYCCVFRIKFENIREKNNVPDNVISYSKCRNVKLKGEHPLNNGRIRAAETLETTITDIDFSIYEKYYEWDKIKIGTFYRYKRGYLPTAFIEAIGYLYKAKTELKGVAGAEEEYQHAKALLNALYGMTVQDPVKDTIFLYDNWTSGYKEELKNSSIDFKHYYNEIKKDALQKYNASNTRFLHYSWGVWCTAYARRNLLLSMINITSDDHNYSDTDSMKIFNRSKHEQFITKYNKWITKRIDVACEFHHIDAETFRPKTIKGVTKQLGVWDYEGTYDMFKTLGAKRYMTLSGDTFSITVAGIDKNTAIPYLLKKHNIEFFKDKNGFHITKNKENIIDVFLKFEDGLYFPPEVSGKMSGLYIDKEINGEITDYQGNTASFSEMSAVYIKESEYVLGVDYNYFDLLTFLKI